MIPSNAVACNVPGQSELILIAIVCNCNCSEYKVLRYFMNTLFIALNYLLRCAH